MARLPVHIFAADPLTGNALASVSCLVKNRATGASASLWDAEVAGSSVSNPLTTNSNGRAFAWTDSAQLQIDYSGAGITAYSEYRAAPIDFVSALPGSPYDTQEIYYQSAAMATVGTAWHLRYRLAASGSYKWEFLGGGELNAVNTTAGTTTTGTTAAFGNTPTVTVPLPGDYYVGATGDWSTADSTKQGNIQIGNGTILTAVSRHGWAANNTNVSFANSGLLSALAASDQVKLYGFTSGGAATLTATTKQLTVRPIRVG